MNFKQEKLRSKPEKHENCCLLAESLLLIFAFSRSLSRCNSRNSLVLLQVQERDGVAESDECVFGDVADVIGSHVEVTESVQRSQGFARYLVQVVVSQTQILKIFYEKVNRDRSEEFIKNARELHNTESFPYLPSGLYFHSFACSAEANVVVICSNSFRHAMQQRKNLLRKSGSSVNCGLAE